MILENFLKRLKTEPEAIEFSETIALIDELYEFFPTSFRNGDQLNQAGQNNGSCKIFYFGKLHQLGEQEVLACFGRFYREDVLNNPTGTDHQNIRNFMVSGWAGIHFEGEALKARA